MNYLYYKRRKLHFESNGKRRYNRIVSVETEKNFEKTVKTVSIFMALVFFSIPFWIIPLIDVFVHYGNNAKTFLGGG